MKRQLFLIVTGIGLYVILAAAPARAHHAFAAEYDSKKPVRVSGTVSKLELINPHSWIHIEVKNNEGKVEEWMIEAASPNTLISRGFTRDFLKIGTEVTVDGYQSKNGSLHVNGRDLTLPNGQPLFLGSSGTGAPYDDASVLQDEQKVVRTQVAGAWWMNAVLMQRLGITEEQRVRIERAFENHRLTILSTTDQLEKEESLLARLLDGEQIDRNAIYTQIDRVIQARSETERASAMMTLEMREQLTRAQWAQLPRTNLAISATGRGGRIATPAPLQTPPTPAVPGQRRGQ